MSHNCFVRSSAIYLWCCRNLLERDNVGDNVMLHIRAFSRQNTLNHVASLYHDGVRLPSVYTHMKPINFGRIVSYLPFVYRVSDILPEQTIREAVRVTISDLKDTDSLEYMRKG